MKAAAIIVAAGSGTRAGEGAPKQLRRLLGQPVLAWSVGAFQQHPGIGPIIVVTRADLLEDIENADWALGVTVVEGGATRAASVLNGLGALESTAETPVLIHDAARPGLSQTMISSLLHAL